jgi:hypothetical protein
MMRSTLVGVESLEFLSHRLALSLRHLDHLLTLAPLTAHNPLSSPLFDYAEAVW